MVLNLKSEESNSKFLKGYKSKQIKEEISVAENLVDHQNSYSFYKGRKVRSLGFRLPLLVFLGLSSWEYI